MRLCIFVFAGIIAIGIVSCRKTVTAQKDPYIQTSAYFIDSNEHWAHTAWWLPGTDTARFFIDYTSIKDTQIHVVYTADSIDEVIQCRKIKAHLRQYGPVDKGIDSAVSTKMLYCFYFAKRRIMYYFRLNSYLEVAQNFSQYKTGFVFPIKRDTITEETHQIIGNRKYRAFMTSKGYKIIEGISLFDHSTPYNTTWNLPSSFFTSVSYSSGAFQYSWKRP